MIDQYDLEELVRECRNKANELFVCLDSVEITEDEEELIISVEDAGNFFLGVAQELIEGDD